MFIDASAIVGILLREVDAEALQTRLEQADRRFTSAIAIYEASLGIARVLRIPVAIAAAEVDNFISGADVQVIAITAEIGRGAIGAFERFGRGRHPAALNLGDCFAYACARALAVPLLFKGGDFAQTDIAQG